MSIHLTNALNMTAAYGATGLPVMPWEPTPAMLEAARRVSDTDEHTLRALYAAMLAAYGNEA